MLIELFQKALLLDRLENAAKNGSLAIGGMVVINLLRSNPPLGVDTWSDKTNVSLSVKAKKLLSSSDSAYEEEIFWLRRAERRAWGVVGIALIAGVGTLVYDLLKWG